MTLQVLNVQTVQSDSANSKKVALDHNLRFASNHLSDSSFTIEHSI